MATFFFFLNTYAMLQMVGDASSRDVVCALLRTVSDEMASPFQLTPKVVVFLHEFIPRN